MKYQAEIFDKFQYLYDKTGFTDHQLHSVIKFENKVNAAVMEKAVIILVKTVPILSRVYKNTDGNSYWEDTEAISNIELFKVVYDEDEFNKFTFSKTNEAIGPQIKVCLLDVPKSSISIVMNHMVTDGGGIKECLYLLADIYSKLLDDFEYKPNFLIDGNRSFKDIISSISFKDKIKIFLMNNKDNNQKSLYEFPMSKGKEVSPFILTHDINKEKFDKIKDFCNKNNITLNDFILTAYFRVLSKMLGLYGEYLHIPIMIDMRRYIADKKVKALTNLSSTVIINIKVDEEESFNKTLFKINSQMNIIKRNYIGVNTFLKLYFGSRLLGRKLSYKVLESSLENPKITMTNIGKIDSEKLIFKGSQVINSYICGSIKYRPYFQMAISSFNDNLTLCVNLYGDKEDQRKMAEFLNLMDFELNIVG